MTQPDIRPKPGFDWHHVAWNRPGAPRAVLCSYCSAAVSEDHTHIEIWRQDGRVAQFCEDCINRWWGMA